MTNGEKIQQMFPRKCPHIGFNENFGRIWLMQDGEDFANFTLKWWNAEYTEPTTKNDSSELEKNSKELDGESDCISRADARSLICNIDIKYRMFGMTRKVFKDLYNGMDDLPSVTPEELRWVPVSERLPEKSGNYWCIFGGTNLTGSDYYTTESDAKEIFNEPEEYVGWRSQNVIAWMPLPQPQI